MSKETTAQSRIKYTDANIAEYAELRAQGMTARQAFIKVFPQAQKWKPESIDPKASALEKRDKYQTRLKEIEDAAISESIQRGARGLQGIIDKCEAIINAKITDYAEIDRFEQRIVCKDLSKIDTNAIKSIKFDYRGNAIIELYDPVQYAKLLADILEKKEAASTDNSISISLGDAEEYAR